jgi:SAM-dependent methyltransferase
MIDYYGPDGWSDLDPGVELHRQRVAREVIADLAARAPAGPFRVLDAGCGDGTFVDRLARTLDRPGTRFTGVDRSEFQLAKARRLAEAADAPYDFRVADLGVRIPFDDATFDLVHAAEVIEHLLDPDLLVDEAARVLRPGGHVVITTPNLHAWFNRILFVAGIQPLFHETSTRSTQVGAGPLRRWKRYDRPVGHLRLFNRAALEDLLRRAGLRPVGAWGARYHDMPRAGQWLDSILCRRPSLAAVLVVVARKD